MHPTPTTPQGTDLLSHSCPSNLAHTSQQSHSSLVVPDRQLPALSGGHASGSQVGHFLAASAAASSTAMTPTTHSSFILHNFGRYQTASSDPSPVASLAGFCQIPVRGPTGEKARFPFLRTTQKGLHKVCPKVSTSACLLPTRVTCAAGAAGQRRDGHKTASGSLHTHTHTDGAPDYGGNGNGQRTVPRVV